MTAAAGPDHLEEQTRATPSKLLRGLTDRSKRYREQGSELEIVEPNYGNLTRHTDSPLA